MKSIKAQLRREIAQLRNRLGAKERVLALLVEGDAATKKGLEIPVASMIAEDMEETQRGLVNGFVYPIMVELENVMILLREIEGRLPKKRKAK